MTRVIALFLLSAILCACTYTPSSGWTRTPASPPDDWMASFYGGSGPRGASGGGP